MHKCSHCSKEFETRSGYNRHRANYHSDDPVSIKLCLIETKKIINLKQYEAYISKFIKCKYCEKEFFSKYNSVYCSQSCAAYCSAYNRNRPPMSQEQRNNISITLKEFNEEQKILNPRTLKRYQYTCEVCEKEFEHSSNRRKVCSLECGYELSSITQSSNIANGISTNFSSPIENFTYKHITINCDSKLEAAAIIFLIDYVGVDSIERFNSILYYKNENDENRRFVPDFYVRKNTERLVVEVKSVYKSALAINDYNKYLVEKRNSLEAFCNDRGFIPMWLTTDYDPKFKSIYRKINNFLMDKNNKQI